MKILSIVGARPQFIKLGPLSKEIRKQHNEIIVHTGQHFDKEMSANIFSDLEIPKPDYNLKIHGGNHGEQTGRMMIDLEKLVQGLRPEAIIVFGDTNSTIAGAIVGSKLNIPIVHVEAGLRSFNRNMPEEINRIITDHTSQLLFSPTMTAVKNLENEGLKNRTFFTGDIMVDALMQNVEKVNIDTTLKRLKIKTNKYFLLTLHRPYNVDDPSRLSLILKKLSQIQTLIIFPIHPRTEKVLSDNKIKIGANIFLIKPQGYLDFLSLINSAKKVLTDSGGIQKEAYILKIPCLTIRTETEWTETIKGGWNKLIGPENHDFIEQIISTKAPKNNQNIFGENVAKKMVSIINKNLTKY